MARADLFDHLIGAQHYRWGYGKTKRRGGLAVQDHLQLGRQLTELLVALFPSYMNAHHHRF
jgi:hypothetical protein